MTSYNGDIISFGSNFFNSTKDWTVGYRNLSGNLISESVTPVVVTNYRLAAVDTGVGRRVWDSVSIDFSQAPSPVGSWNVNTLTILYSWQ
jgi:hypothetical protein